MVWRPDLGIVLNVANTYAATRHRGYWTALYAEIDNGGRAAMLHDLLTMDQHGFDARAVPQTAAKASLRIAALTSRRLGYNWISASPDDYMGAIAVARRRRLIEITAGFPP